MYVYVYVHVYVYVCVYVYMHICVYTYIYTYMCIQICIYTHIDVYIYRYLSMCWVCHRPRASRTRRFDPSRGHVLVLLWVSTSWPTGHHWEMAAGRVKMIFVDCYWADAISNIYIYIYIYI